MTRAVAVVLAFGAQHEAVQSAGLTNGGKAIEPAGQNFMDVRLVAYVETERSVGSIENGVQRQRQFHDAQIWAQMAAGLGEV